MVKLSHGLTGRIHDCQSFSVVLVVGVAFPGEANVVFHVQDHDVLDGLNHVLDLDEFHPLLTRRQAASDVESLRLIRVVVNEATTQD